MPGDRGESRPKLLQPATRAFFRQQNIDFSQSYTTTATNEPESPKKQDKMTRANRLAEMCGNLDQLYEEYADQPIPVNLLLAYNAVVDAFRPGQVAGDGQDRVNRLFTALDNARQTAERMPQVRPWGTLETSGQEGQPLGVFLDDQIRNLTGPGNLQLARDFYENLQQMFRGLEDRAASRALRGAIITVGREVMGGDLPSMYSALTAFTNLFASNAEALNRMKAEAGKP